jgi:hypothetical protein
VNKSQKAYRDQMSLQGWSGTGRRMTDEEMIASVKIHAQSIKKEEDFEVLARWVGYDIDSAVEQAISE